MERTKKATDNQNDMSLFNTKIMYFFSDTLIEK